MLGHSILRRSIRPDFLIGIHGSAFFYWSLHVTFMKRGRLLWRRVRAHLACGYGYPTEIVCKAR